MSTVEPNASAKIDDVLKELAEVKEVVGALKQLVAVLVDRQTVKEFYSVAEFAQLMHKTEYTTREWCRLGRINAIKRQHGRAGKFEWAISHDEYLRYQREGLLPIVKPR